jgi:hypothetical protein
MQQDLDTPAALAALVDLADAILAAAEAGQDITKAQQTFRTCSAVLGLRLDNESVEDRVTEGWSKHLQRFDG